MNNTPTLETDALIATDQNHLEDDQFMPASIYWRMTDLCRKLERERDSWREAAYSLAEALPPSWEELQPPAEQLRKFKEMVALQNEKTKKLLDNADKHSKMYP